MSYTIIRKGVVICRIPKPELITRRENVQVECLGTGKSGLFLHANGESTDADPGRYPHNACHFHPQDRMITPFFQFKKKTHSRCLQRAHENFNLLPDQRAGYWVKCHPGGEYGGTTAYCTGQIGQAEELRRGQCTQR